MPALNPVLAAYLAAWFPVLMSFLLCAFIVVPLMGLAHLAFTATGEAWRRNRVSTWVDAALLYALLLGWCVASYCALYGVFVWPMTAPR